MSGGQREEDRGIANILRKESRGEQGIMKMKIGIDDDIRRGMEGYWYGRTLRD